MWPQYLTPIYGDCKTAMGVWVNERQLAVVMPTAGNDVEICIVNCINQPVGFINASRPVAGQVAQQRIRLADT